MALAVLVLIGSFIKASRAVMAALKEKGPHDDSGIVMVDEERGGRCSECRKPQDSLAHCLICGQVLCDKCLPQGSHGDCLAPHAKIVTAVEDDALLGFQIQVKVDGFTVTLDVNAAWTMAGVRAELRLKTRCGARDGYYLVARGGKPLGDDDASTLAMLGVGSGDLLELRHRMLGGMPCGDGADDEMGARSSERRPCARRARRVREPGRELGHRR